ncbi:hypothetical protein KAI58_01760 [Candidatus Gracilibacteria bacterium]|nr:hypothetical protein [Candidatus Gracilibacteria bacterium]
MKKILNIFGGILSCLFSTITLAQIPVKIPIPDHKIIKIKTVEISPIEVALFKSTSEIPLAGRLFVDVDTPIETISFTLFDKNKAEVWNSMLADLKTSAGEKGFYPFSFSNKEINLKGVYFLQVAILDKDEKEIASGGQDLNLNLSDGIEKLMVSELVVIDDVDEVKVGFIFQNDDVKRNVRFQVRIVRNVAKSASVENLNGKLQSFSPNEKRRIDFSLKKEFKPGPYLLKVSVLSEDGIPLSGELQGAFFVDGNFVVLTDKILSFDENLTDLEGTFSFAGKIREATGRATLRARLTLKDGETTLFEETKSIIASQGKIEGDFDITLSQWTTQFSGTIEIIRANKVILTEDINSSIFTAKIPGTQTVTTESIEKTIAPILTRLSNKILLLIAVLTFTLMLILFHIIKTIKKSFNIWLLTILLIPNISFAVDATSNDALFSDHPLLRWFHPINTWSFNPTDTTLDRFQMIRIEGEVFDVLTTEGFLTNEIKQFRLQFSDGINVLQYPYLPSDPTLTISTDKVRYTWEINLNSLNDLYTLNGGTDPITDFGNGDLSIQVLMFKGPDASCNDLPPADDGSCSGTNSAWYGTDWTGEIVIDSTPPTIDNFAYNPDFTVTGFTNLPTEITISCSEPSSESGCFTENYPPFDVKGNFCSDSNTCDNNSPRGFEVCDNVGNCTTPTNNELAINWYDSKPPIINSLQLLLNSINGLGPIGHPGNLKANATYSLELNSTEPNTTPQTSVDDDACGDPSLSPFKVVDTTHCAEKEVACVVTNSGYSNRGIDSGAGCISTECGVGYTFDGNYCVPLCSFDRFDPVFMCFGLMEDPITGVPIEPSFQLSNPTP